MNLLQSPRHLAIGLYFLMNWQKLLMQMFAYFSPNYNCLRAAMALQHWAL